MDYVSLASGDNHNSPRLIECIKPENEDCNTSAELIEIENSEIKNEEINPQTIEDNEIKLKDRIAQCRGTIESLKHELSKEKSRLEKETKMPPTPIISEPKPRYHAAHPNSNLLEEVCSSNIYSACVDSKLNCDESLIEYEKQLEKYQNTLNMAQIEKKNAIRKHMLAKAYRLKLLEVENQCNIELLRVKQSLQCLEPLQMIANQWKLSSNDPGYDLDTYELLPIFPELGANSSSDMNSYKVDCDSKASPENTKICCKEDSSSSEC